MRFALKTLSYSLIHFTVATSVAYALTGDMMIALGIGLIEPAVQTIAFAFHEYLWERKPALALAHSHHHQPHYHVKF